MTHYLSQQLIPPSVYNCAAVVNEYLVAFKGGIASVYSITEGGVGDHLFDQSKNLYFTNIGAAGNSVVGLTDDRFVAVMQVELATKNLMVLYLSPLCIRLVSTPAPASQPLLAISENASKAVAFVYEGYYHIVDLQLICSGVLDNVVSIHPISKCNVMRSLAMNSDGEKIGYVSVLGRTLQNTPDLFGSQAPVGLMYIDLIPDSSSESVKAEDIGENGKLAPLLAIAVDGRLAFITDKHVIIDKSSYYHGLGPVLTALPCPGDVPALVLMTYNQRYVKVQLSNEGDCEDLIRYVDLFPGYDRTPVVQWGMPYKGLVPGILLDGGGQIVVFDGCRGVILPCSTVTTQRLFSPSSVHLGRASPGARYPSHYGALTDMVPILGDRNLLSCTSSGYIQRHVVGYRTAPCATVEGSYDLSFVVGNLIILADSTQPESLAAFVLCQDDGSCEGDINGAIKESRTWDSSGPRERQSSTLFLLEESFDRSAAPLYFFGDNDRIIQVLPTKIAFYSFNRDARSAKFLNSIDNLSCVTQAACTRGTLAVALERSDHMDVVVLSTDGALQASYAVLFDVCSIGMVTAADRTIIMALGDSSGGIYTCTMGHAGMTDLLKSDLEENILVTMTPTSESSFIAKTSTGDIVLYYAQGTQLRKVAGLLGSSASLITAHAEVPGLIAFIDYPFVHIAHIATSSFTCAEDCLIKWKRYILPDDIVSPLTLSFLPNGQHTRILVGDCTKVLLLNLLLDNDMCLVHSVKIGDSVLRIIPGRQNECSAIARPFWSHYLPLCTIVAMVERSTRDDAAFSLVELAYPSLVSQSEQGLPVTFVPSSAVGDATHQVGWYIGGCLLKTGEGLIFSISCDPLCINNRCSTENPVTDLCLSSKYGRKDILVASTFTHIHVLSVLSLHRLAALSIEAPCLSLCSSAGVIAAYFSGLIVYYEWVADGLRERASEISPYEVPAATAGSGGFFLRCDTHRNLLLTSVEQTGGPDTDGSGKAKYSLPLNMSGRHTSIATRAVALPPCFTMSPVFSRTRQQISLNTGYEPHFIVNPIGMAWLVSFADGSLHHIVRIPNEFSRSLIRLQYTIENYLDNTRTKAFAGRPIYTRRDAARCVLPTRTIPSAGLLSLDIMKIYNTLGAETREAIATQHLQPENSDIVTPVGITFMLSECDYLL